MDIYDLLPVKKHKVLETCVEEFDNILGGGLPVGKITEVVGDPDSGKTKLMFDIIENLKDRQRLVVYIATSSKSFNYLKARGLSELDYLVLLNTNDEDRIMNFIKNSIKDVDLFIIDNMSDILTENEKEGFDLNQYQDMPKILRNLDGAIHGEDCAMIVINHLTYKNNEPVSRWRNAFDHFCSAKILIDEQNRLKLIRHKIQPKLVGGDINERSLRMG